MTSNGNSVGRAAVGRVVAALLVACLICGARPGVASAQTQTPFGGGFDYNSGSPIEVSADSLEVRNEDSVAIFRGSVRVRQDEVTMTANELRVTYASAESSTGAIDRLEAIGEVIITNGCDTARADRADYDIAAGEVLMSGEVMLLQGRNAVAGPRLSINLTSGTATMQGPTRVLIGAGEAGADCP